MQPTKCDEIGDDWFDRIFVFWIGTAPMTPPRQKCLETLGASECKIYLVTDETLPSFVHPGAPLHEAYPYLSPVHRSDYLRAYFMHFYGGGYSDIKRVSASWRPAFEAVYNTDAIGAGYQEVPKGTGRFHRSHVTGNYYYLENRIAWPLAYVRYRLQNARHKSLIGNCSFLFRPNNMFTCRWLSIVEQRLDLLLPLLRENPARHPKEIPGKDYGEGPSRYPVPWSFLLGDILGPLSQEYRNQLLRILPSPDFTNYE